MVVLVSILLTIEILLADEPNYKVWDGFTLPVLAELGVIAVTYFYAQMPSVGFFRKLIVGGSFFVITSASLASIYVMDDVQAMLHTSARNALQKDPAYYYSLDGNVAETKLSELVVIIRSQPDSAHLIYNPSTDTWASWKTYPSIAGKVGKGNRGRKLAL